MTDPISLALAERREEVLAEEAAAEQLQELLAGPASLDADLLVGLLQATWARLPEDVGSIPWISQTARGRDAILNEILAIGAKVGDVLEVYSNTLDQESVGLSKETA